MMTQEFPVFDKSELPQQDKKYNLGLPVFQGASVTNSKKKSENS